MTLHERLADPSRYAQQIERLHRRVARRGALYDVTQDGVTLASLSFDGREVARRLAREVGAGRYRLAPLEARTIRAGGKARRVFAARLTDRIVHGVVASALEAAIEPTLSRSLHSYRAGVSWWRPVAELAAYVRRHRAERPDPRTRGLHVLRRDVEGYTDSIPVTDDAPIWPMVSAAAGDRVADADACLVRDVVRPLVTPEDDASPRRLDRGVATGQPISCVLFNLYLSPLDHLLDRVPGAFYARYSDDLVFAHPDAEVVRQAERTMNATLAELGLRFREGKSHDVWLTAAARPSAERPSARARASVPLLGCEVTAAGTVALERAKARDVCSDLERRVRRTVGVLADRDLDARGRAACAAVNRALEPWTSFSQASAAAFLRRVVTDRPFLRQLDYRVARIVVRALTGRPGVRELRRVPYRKLREEWGLVSLEHARNRWGRWNDGTTR